MHFGSIMYSNGNNNINYGATNKNMNNKATNKNSDTLINNNISNKTENKINEKIPKEEPKIKEIEKLSSNEKINNIENSLLEKNILYNISKRLYHKRPVSYRPICYTYIFCYIPIIYKSFNSLRYSTAFLYISAIFCTIGLFLDFAF